MYYYKISIQYDGTNFAGFQWQKDLFTIQDEINKALSNIVQGKVTTMGASRTDTGVHAFHQVVKVTSEQAIDFNKIKNLPPSIRLLSHENCDGNFKPAIDSYSKEYRYFFTNNKIVSEDNKKFIANIANNLDFELMKQCCELINGSHDFCNFYSQGSNVSSTVREILVCKLELINPHDVYNNTLFPIPEEIQSCYQFKIIGKGFLKQMNRHLISAIWMVGSGKISMEDFKNYLNGPKVEKQLWKVAPPNGLYLFQINY